MTSFFFTFFKVFLNGCLGLFVTSSSRLFQIRRPDKLFFKLFSKFFEGDLTTDRDTNLKLSRFPARSPLPVAALPCMSLIPVSSIHEPTRMAEAFRHPGAKFGVPRLRGPGEN
jgi:hypothetical protein